MDVLAARRKGAARSYSRPRADRRRGRFNPG